VSAFTVPPTVTRQCGCSGRLDSPFAGLMEKIMSKTTMQNSKASLEVSDLKDGLSDEKLKKVSGGYIGETEKNASETITGRRIQKFQ